MDQLKIYSLPKYIILQTVFSLLGVFFYISLIFLFCFYYKNLGFIKQNIFTFILVNSLSPLILLFIDNPTYKIAFSFFSETIQFSLILYFIDNCLTSSNISKDNKEFQIDYKIYIILIFMISSFPFNNYLDLFEKTIFDQNVIKMVLIILFHEQIREKLKNLLEYLNDKINSNDSDMPHEIAYYYYNICKIISKMFYTSFILFFIYFILKLFDHHFFTYKITLEYICFFINLFAIYSLVVGCILFFYSLNRNKLLKIDEKIFRKENSLEETQTFRVIDVDIPQEDINENTEHSSNKKRKKEKKKSMMKKK